ncbi:hypothetical protein Droror1_Dr00002352, partial [Drosera rotundifolia]
MEGSSKRKTSKRREIENNDDDDKFKSKNLHAERSRRQRISDRLLQLRALVPNITNMKKATIVCDAIDYINELEEQARELSEQLSEMEACGSGEELKLRSEQDDEKNAVKKWNLEPEVKVVQVDYNKIWIKLTYKKRHGTLTSLVEAMSILGYEFTDTSFTTSKGVAIFTSCLE